MLVSLRKSLFLVLMVLALFAGTLGLTVRAVTAPLAHPNHINIQMENPFTHNSPLPNCPPPPYDC